METCSFGKTAASLIVFAAASLHAEDLTVGADETRTISTSAEYETITVDGTLTVDSSATVAGTAIAIGSTGRVVVDSAVLRGNVTFQGNTAGVTNELHLVGEGAQLQGYVVRSGTTPSRVVFNGGLIKSVALANPLVLSAAGPLILEAVNSHPIWFDIGSNHVTFGKFNVADAELWLVGDGGVKFEHQGQGAWQPLHMSGDYFGFSPKEYWKVTGPIVLDKYGARAFHNNQFDMGDTPRAWVLADPATHLYLGGYRHLVSSITGPGVVGTLNAATAASILDAVVDADESWRFEDRNITVNKSAAGTVTFTGKVPQTVTVTDGGLVFPNGRQPQTFRHYRFKVDKARYFTGAYDHVMQFTELRLYDGANNVTASRTGASCGSTHIADAWSQALDGVISKSSKWCDTTVNGGGNPDDVWIQVDFAAGQRVTSYDFVTGGDAIIDGRSWRDPVSWRFLGSNDGETWHVLDQQEDYPTTSERLAAVGPFPVTEPDGIAPVELDEKLAATVGANGALTFGPARVVEFDSLFNLGAINYGAKSELRCGREDGDQCLYNPVFAGTGDLVKNGADTVTIVGPQAHTGRTVVNAGKLVMRPSRGGRFTHYRFKLDGVRTVNGYDKYLQFSEFRLYNGSDNVTGRRTGFSCGATTSIAGGDVPVNTMDGNVGTKWCDMSYSKLGRWDDCWIQLDFAEGQPVTKYSFCTANDAIISKDADGNPTQTWRDPISWRLLASEDGVVWYELDKRVNYPTTPLRLTEVGPFAPEYCDFSGVSTSAALLPATSEVRIAAGAELDLSAGVTPIGALAVDMAAGAGTLRGFVAAANGELRLSNVPDGVTRRNLSVPLVFVDVKDASLLDTWNVLFDGEVALGANTFHAKIVDGALQFQPKGFCVIVR